MGHGDFASITRGETSSRSKCYYIIVDIRQTEDWMGVKGGFDAREARQRLVFCSWDILEVFGEGFRGEKGHENKISLVLFIFFTIY